MLEPKSPPKPLSELTDAICAIHTTATVVFDGPTVGGWWFADIRCTGKPTIVVEWRPKHGYGVSLITEHDGYGEGPDEVFTDITLATASVLELMGAS